MGGLWREVNYTVTPLMHSECSRICREPSARGGLIRGGLLYIHWGLLKLVCCPQPPTDEVLPRLPRIHVHQQEADAVTLLHEAHVRDVAQAKVTQNILCVKMVRSFVV